MNYVIAVLPDRIQAEAAYSQLEKEGIPQNQMSILGRGYKTADEFGFIDPQQPARQQSRLLSFWLIPFGFIGGVAFNLATNYEVFPEIGLLGNRILGGVLGAVGGAMGSFFVGGLTGASVGSGDALPYRNRLKEGKYIVAVSGAPNITNKASSILKQFQPESLQGYVDPNRS